MLTLFDVHLNFCLYKFVFLTTVCCNLQVLHSSNNDRQLLGIDNNLVIIRSVQVPEFWFLLFFTQTWVEFFWDREKTSDRHNLCSPVVCVPNFDNVFNMPISLCNNTYIGNGSFFVGMSTLFMAANWQEVGLFVLSPSPVPFLFHSLALFKQTVVTLCLSSLNIVTSNKPLSC